MAKNNSESKVTRAQPKKAANEFYPEDDSIRAQVAKGRGRAQHARSDVKRATASYDKFGRLADSAGSLEGTRRPQQAADDGQAGERRLDGHQEQGADHHDDLTPQDVGRQRPTL